MRFEIFGGGGEALTGKHKISSKIDLRFLCDYAVSRFA